MPLQDKLSSLWMSLWTRPTPEQSIRAALQQPSLSTSQFDHVLNRLRTTQASLWERSPSGMTLLEWLWEGKGEDGASVLSWHQQLLQASLVILEQGVKVGPEFIDRLTVHVVSSPYKSHRLIRLLLAQGVNPDLQLASHVTLVRFALREGRAQIANVVLEAGANPLQKDNEGNTLLHALAMGAFEDTRRTRSSVRHSRRSPDDKDDGCDARRDDDACFQTALETLVKAGVDINALNAQGQSAYALADARLRQMMQQLSGFKCEGFNHEGHSLAYESIAHKDFSTAQWLLSQDPVSFRVPDACGAVPAWGWWEINDPPAANQAIDWLKQHGLWAEALEHVSTQGSSFLTYGLRTCADSADQIKRMDWKLARLESELPAQMWVEPDIAGETLNFWLTGMERQDLVDKYVHPRREAMIKASLNRVELQQSAPRPRF